MCTTEGEISLISQPLFENNRFHCITVRNCRINFTPRNVGPSKSRYGLQNRRNCSLHPVVKRKRERGERHSIRDAATRRKLHLRKGCGNGALARRAFVARSNLGSRSADFFGFGSARIRIDEGVAREEDTRQIASGSFHDDDGN